MKKSIRKNYILRVAGLLLLACMLVLNATSGVVARFTEAVEFSPQYVRVAAFRVLVNGKVLNTGNKLVVNLFDTLYSSVDNLGTTDPMAVLQDTIDGTDTKEHGGSDLDDSAQIQNPAYHATTNPVRMIAPGNGGQFAISVTNQSEVPISYSVSLKALVNEPEIPIEFRVKSGTNWTGWVDYNDPIIATLAGSGTLTAGGGTKPSVTNDVLFQWRWKFGEDPNPDALENIKNVADTNLGIIERKANAGELEDALDPMSFYESQRLSVTIEAKAAQLD